MHLNRSLTSSMKSGWYLWLLCFLISLAVAQARNHTIREFSVTVAKMHKCSTIVCSHQSCTGVEIVVSTIQESCREKLISYL